MTVLSVADSVFSRLTSAVTSTRSPDFSGSNGISMSDRKSTRLNSRHLVISYAVFCLKKKPSHQTAPSTPPTPEYAAKPPPSSATSEPEYHHDPSATPAPTAAASPQSAAPPDQTPVSA